MLDCSLVGSTHEAIVRISNRSGVIGRATIEFRYEEVCFSLPIKDNHNLQILLQVDRDQLNKIFDKYTPFDRLADVNMIKKFTKQRSIGLAKVELGYRPKYPVIIIPGLASSALECWQTTSKEWHMCGFFFAHIVMFVLFNILY